MIVTYEIKNAALADTFVKIAPDQMDAALEAIGTLFAARAQDNIAGRTGPDGSWPYSGLSQLFAGPRIWSDISRSISAQVSDHALTIGATHIAARVRQLGTVGAGGTEPDIVPVKKKLLTIPMNDAASKASYDGLDARTAFPGSFLLKPEHGASPLNVGVIVRKVGGKTNRKTGEKENQQLEVLYLLVSRVAIRPHRFLPFDANGNIQPQDLLDEAKQLLANAFIGGVV